jgi:CheY-like chemotaxis protein
MKIIIADDDSIRYTIARSLNRSGYEVVAVENGQKVLEALKVLSEKVGLVITDINMPIMDGITLIKELRNNQLYAEIPILAMSGTEDGSNAINVGANEFMKKPCDLNMLLVAIKRLTNFNQQQE